MKMPCSMNCLFPLNTISFFLDIAISFAIQDFSKIPLTNSNKKFSLLSARSTNAKSSWKMKLLSAVARKLMMCISY